MAGWGTAMDQMQSNFNQRLIVSGIIAACAFLWFGILGQDQFLVRIGGLPGLVGSFVFSAVWLYLVMAAIKRHRKRGLWLLVGAPLALFWPIALLSTLIACSAARSACP